VQTQLLLGNSTGSETRVKEEAKTRAHTSEYTQRSGREGPGKKIAAGGGAGGGSDDEDDDDRDRKGMPKWFRDFLEEKKK